MEYKKRVLDEVLEKNMEAFGAVLIVGTKGSGKTTTASQKAKTTIEFQDEDQRENLLMIANTAPSKLLGNPRPILFDEWQDAPKIWGTIRKACDDHPEENGQFLLTGSTSQIVEVPHTGTLRIAHLRMLPMSLYESGESNGSVSLKALFDDPGSFESCSSGLSLDAMIFALCRGGWPKALLNKNDAARLSVAKELFRQTYSVDISNVDHIKRNPVWAQAILRSYSRNICTLAETKTIFGDAAANCGIGLTTFFEYVEALESLFIVDDLDAWCPAIRSKAAIRSSKKRNLVDPSIAVAALGLSPEYFSKDFKTLGFLFESLCIRDLKAYSSPLGGTVSYYHDRYGLEADAVLHLEDGRYALLEFKLGESEVAEGAEHLCEIERLVKEHNLKEKQCPLRMPDLKMIITATQYGYKRPDGVLVVPIGCLKD